MLRSWIVTRLSLNDSHPGMLPSLLAFTRQTPIYSGVDAITVRSWDVNTISNERIHNALILVLIYRNITASGTDHNLIFC
jgi:hypothetical protein